MIQSYKDYLYYLECDRLSLKKEYKKPKIGIDIIWRYQRLLRKCEYYFNCKNDLVSRIYLKILLLRFFRMSHKLGFSIGLNTFASGLSIVHYGCIVVHSNARIGNNCRIHEGVTIGSNASSLNAPIIGNNVYIASGAKIIGDITIADDVVIGANAVVVRDVLEKGIAVGGVPAKKISQNSSDKYLIKATDII